MSGTVPDQLLADALAYNERGFIVVPVLSDRDATGNGRKRPLVKHGKFSQEGQTTDQVRQLFGVRSRANGVAVMMGTPRTRPGRYVAVRDFDSIEGYERFKERHPSLARVVPTVRTHRGMHIWCESDHQRIVKLADGEYRGSGIALAPHSSHYAGGRYEWLNPLGADLPFIEAEQLTGKKLARDVSECHALIRSETSFGSCSETSPLSETFLDEIVAATLPLKPGERNACILNLARGLKLNAGIVDVDRLREIVKRWHAKALPYIGTKEFAVTWHDFLHAHGRAQHPLGVNIVDAAALQVDPDHLPAVAIKYEGDATRQLVGLCYALAKVNNDGGRFFLSSHDAAPRVGITQMQVWRVLRVFEKDGIIERLKTGNARQATRYRWIGGDL